MLKFNILVLNRLKIMGFSVNAKYIHKHKIILNKAVTELFTNLTKRFLPYLNPTSYLNKEF